MARVTTYLNFPGRTEAAFNFYKSVFGTDFLGPIMRMKDAPRPPEMPALSEAEQQAVMHIALPILAGHVLMGTDALESQGHRLTFGDNVSINLEPDTRAETHRLFDALAVGGTVGMPLTEMFWGSVFGMVTDAYGTKWMFNGPAADEG